ncbi:MAG: hypothetical protein U0229_25240 [Anaeromyxobacter sp.]
MTRSSSAVAAALAAVLAAACGGGGSKKSSGPSEGSTCTKQSDCGSSLLCYAGKCAASLPASPSCASPGGAPALLAGPAVTASDPGVGVCGFSVQTPVFPAGAGLGQVQDLGTHTVGDVVTFTVPADTWSVTIYEQEVGGVAPKTITISSGGGSSTLPNVAIPDQVKSPTGLVIFDDVGMSSPPTGTNGYDDYTRAFYGVHFGASTPYSGTSTFPNASKGLELARVAGALVPGTWSLQVNDYAYECATVYSNCTAGSSTTSKYRVHVVTHGPLRSTGKLDLDVYLATDNANGTARLTAAQAVNDAGMKRLFASAGTFLGRAGLCLGTVTFHDLPDWARSRFALTSYDDTQACDETNQLFRLALTQDSGVHLFFVDELVDANATSSQVGTLLGLDGAIPGPSGLPGSPTSGAIVPIGGVTSGCAGSGLNLATCEADLMAYVTSHEAGHWLGLFHTTEYPGTFFDPLSDTGECPCNKCAVLKTGQTCGQDPSVAVTTSQCNKSSVCTGGDNLMFWLVTPGASSGNLTSQQGEVIRLNPAVEVSP